MDKTNHNEMVKKLIAYVKDNYGLSQDITGDTDLLAVGLDSLDIMNYLLMLQEKYGVEIRDDQLMEGGVLIFNETAKLILELQD